MKASGRFRSSTVTAVLLAAGTSAAPASYLDVARRYAAGERAAAVAELSAWSHGGLARELEALRAAALGAARCPTCPSSIDAPPLRAIVMLHTDREAFERRPAPGSERAPSCGDQIHTAFAERLAALLFSDPDGREFARSWYLAVALRDFGDTCFADAERWADAGLRWFPKDAQLLLARGTIDEATTSLASLSPALGPLRIGERTRVLQGLEERNVRLERAARLFEQAGASDPQLAEARLRLGRVRFRQERRPAAREAFRAVLDASQDPALLYLAHLFLGRVNEADGALGEAGREYSAALALDPQAQAAAVALSQVSQLLGEPGARERLEAALAYAGLRGAPDPYWDYLMARATPRSEALFEDLRQQASR